VRIFVSSSFEDLREHRSAAIRILQQLGHEVIAMENMVAGSAAPLNKVLEMVDRSEAYVGLFAWRYGHIPKSVAGLTMPTGGRIGHTSITHFEYLRAKERGLPILAFLLDESVAVAPGFIDGFDSTRPNSPADAACIRALRTELQTEKVVSWFSTPSDLEARIAAAVTLVGLSRQIDVQSAISIGGGAGDDSVLDSGGYVISNAISEASLRQRVFKIDLVNTWWSSRLFLISALAERLTNIRRIVVVHTPPPRSPEDNGSDVPQSILPRIGDPPAMFVGMLSTSAILKTIGAMSPAFGRFADWLSKQPVDEHDDVHETSHRYLTEGWTRALSLRSTDPNASEHKIKIDLTADRLQRWFGDLMFQQPVEVNDLNRASVVDLMRLLDYPSDFVPVLSGRLQDVNEPTGQVNVVDKSALMARLARSYLNELKERARIA
jgi:Domain of unknown function (DUF4062)